MPCRPVPRTKGYVGPIGAEGGEKKIYLVFGSVPFWRPVLGGVRGVMEFQNLVPCHGGGGYEISNWVMCRAVPHTWDPKYMGYVGVPYVPHLLA